MVSAIFFPGPGVLSIFDDADDDIITLGRNAAGSILVNAGAVAISGGTPTVANTSQIQVFGSGGNDTIVLDESNGALPKVNLFGGAGNDSLAGGAGADFLFGQGGDDTLDGRGGDDFLFGGAGDDRMIWNPGGGSDLVEGGAGNDTAEVDGGNGSEVFTIAANGARVRFDRVSPAPFSLDIGTTENLVLDAGGGDDTISATGNLAALIELTLDGGAGNDTINGSNGDDVLIGGDGDDFIDGNQGADVAFLGAGDDVFQWDPGDGSDIVEGGDGTDTLLFNGSAGAEIFAASPDGGRVRFTRDLGAIVMDLDGVETIELNALGGADRVTVNDLVGTDVTEVAIDLAGTLGGTTGDGDADEVIVNGTNGSHTIKIQGSGTTAFVTGLVAAVTIENLETHDRLRVNALASNDFIDAAALDAGVVTVELDGGDGDDLILGSKGADLLLGGHGNDIVFGNQGADNAFLGAGADMFIWNPGDGSDVVDGGGDTDTLFFHGASIGENFEIVADLGHALLLRDVGTITMDLDSIETVHIDALGGADSIVVGDLGDTDVSLVEIFLNGTFRGPTADGAIDNVTVTGTDGDDDIVAFGDADGIVVTGLSADVEIAKAGPNDRLVINAGAGDDLIDAEWLEGIALTVDAGQGDDLILGSSGDDLVLGGRGDDVALLSHGDDTFVWNPGDGSDVVEGEAGFDTLVFNGAGVGETIAIAANGERIDLNRDVGNIAMDLAGIEAIELAALGGEDTITIGDLTGTDVVVVDIDLSGTPGAGTGDGASDGVVVHGTDSDDTIDIQGDGTSVAVLGLHAAVSITSSEGAEDRLEVFGFDGGDRISAATLAAGITALTIDGGAGADEIFGSRGADFLLGGDGDDFIDGNQGADNAFLGAGDDVFQWDPGDGSDTVDGEEGYDTLDFNGANIAETITVSANNDHATLFRDVGNITIDLDNVEAIRFNALRGADAIVLGDLEGTDVTVVQIDLADTLGGAVPDADVDVVTVTGTDGDDDIVAFGDADGIVVTGLSADVEIAKAGPNDRLVINAGAGDDLIDAEWLEGIALTVDAGQGDDLILGSSGDDLVLGGRGDDVALLSHGDDTFVWNPGDGSDVVEGEAGFDTLVFNGAGVGETIAIAANGERIDLNRDVGNIAMDLAGIEAIELAALGGEDTITIGDLTGTDVTNVSLDLAGALGGTTGDGFEDAITIDATDGDDVISVVGDASGIKILGLAAEIELFNFDAFDRLVINGLGGNDVIDASGLDGILFFANGGDGDDILLASAGADSLTGGPGDDLLVGSATDVLDAAPGADIVLVV